MSPISQYQKAITPQLQQSSVVRKYEILKISYLLILMEGFGIDLKTFLGLAMPNQYSQTVRK